MANILIINWYYIKLKFKDGMYLSEYYYIEYCTTAINFIYKIYEPSTLYGLKLQNFKTLVLSLLLHLLLL